MEKVLVPRTASSCQLQVANWFTARCALALRGLLTVLQMFSRRSQLAADALLFLDL